MFPQALGPGKAAYLHEALSVAPAPIPGQFGASCPGRATREASQRQSLEGRPDERCACLQAEAGRAEVPQQPLGLLFGVLGSVLFSVLKGIGNTQFK